MLTVGAAMPMAMTTDGKNLSNLQGQPVIG
jgi:hypothetical protein